MQVRHFHCTNLNAFLNYDFDFFNDVTFLHGINGSGKTSILRAIASLLTPDPLWLAASTFDQISISFEHHGQAYTISAMGTLASELVITVAGGIELRDTIDREKTLGSFKEEDELIYATFARDDEDAKAKRVIENSTVFKFIASLPTPIFLGLDRTTLSPIASRVQRGRSRSVSSYFRTSLDDALHEAERLLSQQLGNLSIARNRIFASLRNQLVLSLFQPSDQSHASDPFDKPQLTHLQKMRTSVITALRNISITTEEIESTVEPFFANVFSAADRALKAPNLSKNRANFQEIIDSITPYAALQPSIALIERAVERIEAANAQDTIISRPIETYTKIISGFFDDSKKTIAFVDNRVRVTLPSKKTADITALSSGERQIFVLITHLVFNPLMRDENVLLIDEPELSLHLKWQKGFVAAIRAASPGIQMVLATHSPEIIFDLEDKMIPLEF